MTDLQETIRAVASVRDGFKPIRAEADKYVENHSQAQVYDFAHSLYASEIYQARMMATILFGRLASTDIKAFTFLRDKVSLDSDWRVQEMLAMAFDAYCKDIGYEQALPVIKDWLGNGSHNVRRAVSEGLRIWTYRDYFKQHPEEAVSLLSQLKDDEHPYVRKSAGNALRDISRFYKDLVAAELKTWDTADTCVADTYMYASKFI